MTVSYHVPDDDPIETEYWQPMFRDQFTHSWTNWYGHQTVHEQTELSERCTSLDDDSGLWKQMNCAENKMFVCGVAAKGKRAMSLWGVAS